MGTGTSITPKAFILLSLAAAGPQGRATTVTPLVPQCSWHCGLLGLGEPGFLVGIRVAKSCMCTASGVRTPLLSHPSTRRVSGLVTAQAQVTLPR